MCPHISHGRLALLNFSQQQCVAGKGKALVALEMETSKAL